MSETERKPQPEEKSGFTIIEILVVVAIMAILAGISIPQYQKMVNKGNQQGAVAGLTSIYMAEKNYAAENHTYTACISKIGVITPPGTKWYGIGFVKGNLAPSCGQGGTANCDTYVWDEGAPVQSCIAGDDFMPADRVNNLATTMPNAANQALLGTQSTDMTSNAFTARAVGNLSSKSAYDRWSIDQNGTPQNYLNNI